MAFNYETGVANTPLDLLTKFRTFVLAHGWGSGVPSVGDFVLNNPDAELYIGFDATATTLDFRGALGFNAGNAWNDQPNHSGQSFVCNMGAGPYTAYHFFVGDEDGFDYAHIALETSATHYRHLVFGQLIKAGTYDGGFYCDGCAPNLTTNIINSADAGQHVYVCDANNTLNAQGHVQADFDGKVNNWATLFSSQTQTDTRAVGSCRTLGFLDPAFAVGVQQWNLRTPMWPLNYFVNRPSNQRSPIGRIPHMRFLTIRNFTPGELVTVGGETWMVFPFHRRQTEAVAGSVASSSTYGYAYRRS